MIVCLCEGLSEREIQKRIQAGATTLMALGHACNAGVDCGRCRPQLRNLLSGHRATHRGPTHSHAARR